MRLVALLLLVLLGAPLGVAPAWAAEGCEGYYFDPTSISPNLLPTPPAEGSAAWYEQIEKVIAAQRHVAADDLTALSDEQNFRLELMTSPLGPRFNKASLPLTFTLLERVLTDASCVNDTAKKFWKTRRPYLVDKKIHLMVRPVTSNAYPSGHTSSMRVVAEVMGMLMPKLRDALRAHADSIAWHRVMAGVHYPVDVEAGKLEAMQILGALVSDDGFQRDLAAAQHEIAERHPL